MAGGNESPRQKMIGMMYLVLTALLALNVQNSILAKFSILNTTLEGLVVEDKEKSENKLKGILDAKSVEAKVTEAKDKAQKVRELTKAMVIYLDGVKKKLATDASGKALEGEELVLNTNRPEEVMLDGSKPEVGLEYEKQLKAYVKNLNDIMKLKKPFPKLNRKAEDYPDFKNDEHQVGKDYLNFTFEQTPLMGAIAMVSQMQTEILEYESTALDTLNAVAEGVSYKVDQLVAMVDAEANTIVAGNEYKGNLFVAGAASGVTPEMFKDGSPLQLEDVDVGLSSKVKMGKIKFRAGASSYGADGTAKSSFKVKINLPGRSPIERSIEYKVIKPTAIFASAGATTLFRDCGTEVNVTIPGLPDLSTLDLSVPGDQGKVYKISPGKFAILPNRAQCNVNVLIAGTVVQVQKFDTREAPMPTPRVMIGASAIDLAKGIPAGTSTVRIEPEIGDEVFKKDNNKDNKYFITSLVFQVNGGAVTTLKSGSIPVGNLRKGDVISVSQVQVQRPSYDGGQKSVNGKLMSFSCRIN